MPVSVHIFGDEKFRYDTRQISARTADIRPALNLVVDDMMDTIETTFTSQGRRHGGSWKGLDAVTRRQKAKHGQDPRILIASGALMRSMTVRGDQNQRLEMTPRGFTLESTLPYALVHQRGNDRTPQRKFVDFYQADKVRWIGMIKRYILGGRRRA